LIELSLSPGQAFGNYRILSRIGVGGMGMVFLAEHPHIGKRVALKIIHRDLAGNREVVNRFLNEARAVNQIGSEHIVQIHDFGQTEDGEHFFIMEFLDGRTLAQELSTCGVLEVPRALHIAAQIASGLAAAHDSNIIHRDLKPDNVILIDRLGDPDFVKLLDFGLAKFLIDTDSRKLTAAGVVLGTPQYMSPEACESRPDVDQRCDVYSLGVLTFQMLTGRLPFSGESMGEVLIKQVTQAPPAPRGINPNIPPAVEQVVLRCLAKKPSMRFQTMRELRDVLLDPAGYLASSPPIVPVAATPDARTMYRPDGPDRPTELALGMSPRGPDLRGPDPRGPDLRGPDRPTELALGGMASPPPAGPSPWPGSPSTDGRTAYMDESAHRRFAARGDLQPEPRPEPRPEIRHVPRPVENRTMAIKTPPGYSPHPPRRRWWLVLTVAVVGAAAGILGLVLVGDAPSPPRPAPPKPVRVAGATADAAPADAQPAAARIRLTTRPPGAEVSDASGTRIGTTPTEIEIPMDGREVILRFRHPETAELEKSFTPTGDTAFDIDLPPAVATAADAGPKAKPEERESRSSGEKRRERTRKPREKKPKSDDLLRPEF
jgi:serine/threonine protein kinase